MAKEALSTAPARIVCTPGTCGGRPRLDGHRLDINWYAQICAGIGRAKANAHIQRGWDYLRPEQIQVMSDFYDANPQYRVVVKRHGRKTRPKRKGKRNG